MASTPSSLLPSEPLPWRPSTRPKLPPGALLDIDQGPLYDIFTEYLELEDICHLDSALCLRWRREEFLALVSTKVLLFNREIIQIVNISTMTHDSLRAPEMNWILKRGIHLASLSLDDEGDASTRDAVAALAFNGRLDKLETVNISYCAYIKDADLATILRGCYRSVNSISIRGCGLTDSSAMYVKHCSELEAFVPQGNESAADLAEIFQACRKLRRVHLDQFGNRLTDDVVQSVVAHCPFLEHFDIGFCTAVSDAAITKVAESCPLLRVVRLSGTNITNATMVSLCTHCPLLTEVYIDSCRLLTDAAVLAVSERLPGLTHIGLDDIAAITSIAVETLASKCRELTHIDLGNSLNVSDVTLRKIAQQCSNLKKLQVRGCDRVTAAGLALVGDKCSKLALVSISDRPETSASSLRELFPLVKWSINDDDDEDEDDEDEDEEEE
jgi:hypothetical protein